MRILCVDDDPIILALLTEVLRVIGLTNLTACTSASEALDAIDQSGAPFDCFLFDIQMPGMDGIELTSAVRNMPQYRVTPIVMITAMSDRSYVDRAFAAGASDYLTKPFELGEVHARLRLIESLVIERMQMDDRNPVATVGRSLSYVAQADMDEQLSLVDVKGFIEYLALENYLLQIAKSSLVGTYTVGIVVPDLESTFRSSSVYEYKSTIADFAEAIAKTLKPLKFLAAHAGGGKFVCVLENGDKFKAQQFETALKEELKAMDLTFADTRPLALKPVVGEPIALQMESSRNIASSLVRAVEMAKAEAQRLREEASQSSGPLKRMFGQ